MIDIQCILVSNKIEKDNIGNELEQKIKKTIPIIKIEKIYSSEFYQAHQNGFKPNLKIKISALNYDDERIVEYMGNEYDIVRVENEYADEISLICEKRIKNESR